VKLQLVESVVGVKAFAKPFALEKQRLIKHEKLHLKPKHSCNKAPNIFLKIIKFELLYHFINLRKCSSFVDTGHHSKH
jgi:hypothetical protein